MADLSYRGATTTVLHFFAGLGYRHPGPLDVPMNERIHSSEKLVGALTAGLKILRHLAQAEGAAGVNQIARELDMNPSTCFNLLRTLVHEGLITFDAGKKNYTAGLGLLELTKGLTERDAAIRFVRPRLVEVAHAHRVTATLWRRLSEDRLMLVERADTDSALRVHMTVGQRLPAFVAAVGRCMAAYSGLPRDEIRRRFDTLRWEQPPDFEAYWTDVLKAKALGYAIDRDNFVRGVTTVASPVLDGNGASTLVLSAVGFTAQFTPESLEVLADDLRTQTREISVALNGGQSNFPAGK